MDKTLTLNEKLAEVETKLAQFEEENGLPPLKKSLSSRKDYTELTYEEIQQMSAEELENASIILVNLANYLQRKINLYTSRCRWATNLLDLVIAQEGEPHKFCSFAERKGRVILGNEYANRLNNVIINSQLRIDRLNFLPSGIKKVGEEIKNCLYGRRKEKDYDQG